MVSTFVPGSGHRAPHGHVGRDGVRLEVVGTLSLADAHEAVPVSHDGE